MGRKYQKLSSSKLSGWLDLLAATDEGIIKIINMFLSYQHKFVTKRQMFSFLADCVYLRASTPETALRDFDYICGRDTTYFAMLRVDPFSMSGRLILSTTLRSDTFHRYILGRPKTKVKRPLLLPQPKSSNTADEIAYCNALAKETSYVGWYNNKGTLGKPAPDPHYVWFVCKKHLSAAFRSDTRNVPDATKARDILGLIDHRSGTYLLSLEFSALQLHSISGKLSDFRMARPSFLDNGSKRFAVYLNKAAEYAYRDNWGMTVHLGKFAAKPYRLMNGVRERISSPVPLSFIGEEIDVKPIGWVITTRGEQLNIDDDSAFINRLLGTRTLLEIKRKLITIANAP